MHHHGHRCGIGSPGGQPPVARSDTTTLWESQDVNRPCSSRPISTLYRYPEPLAGTTGFSAAAGRYRWTTADAPLRANRDGILVLNPDVTELIAGCQPAAAVAGNPGSRHPDGQSAMII